MLSDADDNLFPCNGTHTTYGDNVFCNAVPALWNRVVIYIFSGKYAYFLDSGKYGKYKSLYYKMLEVADQIRF